MAERSLINRFWYRLLKDFCQLTGAVMFQVRHTGVENIPAQGAALVVSNHQSHFDPPLVGMGCRRRMNYLARDTLFRFAPFGWIIHSVDAIPIDRKGVGLSGIKESLRRLKRGELLVVFPEGTRTPDGQIKPFRPGFTALAVRTKAAIVPAAIEGAYAAWPRWRKLPRPGRIHVHYGPPILPEEIASLDERELLAEVQRRVRQCHAEIMRHPLFSQARATRPAD